MARLFTGGRKPRSGFAHVEVFDRVQEYIGGEEFIAALRQVISLSALAPQMPSMETKEGDPEALKSSVATENYKVAETNRKLGAFQDAVREFAGEYLGVIVGSFHEGDLASGEKRLKTLLAAELAPYSRDPGRADEVMAKIRQSVDFAVIEKGLAGAFEAARDKLDAELMKTVRIELQDKEYEGVINNNDRLVKNYAYALLMQRMMTEEFKDENRLPAVAANLRQAERNLRDAMPAEGINNNEGAQATGDVITEAVSNAVNRLHNKALEGLSEGARRA